MIFQLLFSIVFGLLGVLLLFLPGYGQVPLQLPWGIDGVMQLFISLFHGAMRTLPYLNVVWTCFLYILGFEIALLVFKFFLGSRSPSH